MLSRHQLFDALMLTLGVSGSYSFLMRTTLTLDDDVVYGLKKIQEMSPAKSFKETVNDLLRQALTSPPSAKPKKKFKVKSYPIGLRKDLNFDNIEEVLDILEGVDRR